MITGNAAGAQGRLRRGVDVVAPRARAARAQRLLLVLGALLLPLGLGVILLGWLGAANTPLLFEQIPYLISGGLLGLGLVFTGRFLYFAYWLTRMASQMHEQNALEALVARLDQQRQPPPSLPAPGRWSRPQRVRITTAPRARSWLAGPTSAW